MSFAAQAFRPSSPASPETETGLDFTLKYWCLWQSVETVENRIWPNGELLPFNQGNPDVHFIPMPQRRRMSPLARAACAVAWRCREQFGNMPAVFFSRHGESREYFRLLQDISRGETVSPSCFSLCVHNAIAGLYSIQSESCLPYVALAGGSEGMFAAFFEAAGMLLESPMVLAICYEQALPGIYRPYVANSPNTWALAMVLTKAEQPGPTLRLSRKPCRVPADAACGETDLIQAIANGQRTGRSRQDGSIWFWNLVDV